MAEYVTKTTPDLKRDQIERLKQLFPECVTEGKFDFDRLRARLGDVDALAGDPSTSSGQRDAYTFTWAGKQDAFRAIQTPSTATLKPAPDESSDWDDTRHLFIEGENLAVLKLLYKSYFDRVKMIYIAPPYNTGDDVIYRDAQPDTSANRLTHNPESNAHFHSAWLTMMYPRLYLARQLLREDGTIFVSIDDHEVHHLRLLMNEIFGEENFLASIVWEKTYAPKPASKTFSTRHEYLLVFAKNIEHWDRHLLPRTPAQNRRYKNPDSDRRGPWTPENLLTAEHRDSGVYTIVSPTGRKWTPRKGTSWRYSQEQMHKLIAEEAVWFGRYGTGVPRRKKFLKDVQPGLVPETLWKYTEVGHTQDAKWQIIDLFGYDVFETPKPTSLIKRAAQITTAGDDIVLDFFAGSCSTAQAVLELNREDGGSRRFVMVQLPEPTDNPDFPTVAEIGKERIRRVIADMRQLDEERLPLEMRETPEDLGFKVFKLAPSTFRPWEPPAGEDPAALEQQLAAFEAGLKPGGEPLDVVYEVILKEGYSLNSHIEPLDLETNQALKVMQHAALPETFRVLPPLYICLDDEVDAGTIESLNLDKESVFVCLDTALDDSKKHNLAERCLLKVI